LVVGPVLAVPMLLNEHVDALTAMRTRLGMVRANLQVMLTWRESRRLCS